MFFSLMSLSFAGPQLDNVDIGYNVRFLPIVRMNPDFEASTNDTKWKSLQTIRLETKKTWDHMIIKASFQDVRNWGQEPSPVLASDPFTGIYEGYVQLGSKDNRSFWVRTGRQEYTMHDGMLMWNRPWNPYGITFNGVRGHYEDGAFGIHTSAFVLQGQGSYETVCTAEDCTDFVSESIASNGDFLYIVDATYGVNSKLTLLPYFLVLQQGATGSDAERKRNIFSPGLRLQGRLSPDLSYIAEGTYQFGNHNDRSHQAWRANTSLAYTLEMMKFRLFYEERSGDGDATDDLSNDFEPFFSAGHRFRGFGDYVGSTNIRDIGVSIQGTQSRHFNAKVDYHFFQLSNPTGSWYALGNASRGIGSGDDANLGHEIDIVLNWRPVPVCSLLLGHVFFIPTGEGERIEGGDLSMATYLWMRFEEKI